MGGLFFAYRAAAWVTLLYATTALGWNRPPQGTVRQT